MTGDFAVAVQDAERAQLISDLKAARAELVSRGRCTGSFMEDEKVCTVGALGVVTVDGFAELCVQNRGIKSPRMMRAWSALQDHLQHPGWVADFNDDKTTTDQDVLDLYDKTLADLGGLA